jgi:hypothetical protein
MKVAMVAVCLGLLLVLSCNAGPQKQTETTIEETHEVRTDEEAIGIAADLLARGFDRIWIRPPWFSARFKGYKWRVDGKRSIRHE